MLLESRVRDNKHNWFQLLSGAFIGGIMSVAGVFADETILRSEENSEFHETVKSLSESEMKVEKNANTI